MRQRSRKEKNHPSHRSEGRRGKSQWKSETETAFYATFGTPKYSKSERRRELALKEELKKKKNDHGECRERAPERERERESEPRLEEINTTLASNELPTFEYAIVPPKFTLQFTRSKNAASSDASSCGPEREN